MDKAEKYIKLFQNSSDNFLKWRVTYDLTKLYLENKNVPEAEKWVIEGSKICKDRSEGYFLLLKYFREKGAYDKAYYYYNLGKDIPKPSTGFNIQSEVYDYLFLYEATLLWYYVHNQAKLEGLKMCMDYLNRTQAFFENVFGNLEYYIQPLEHIYLSEYKFQKVDKFVHSSPSIVRLNENQHLLNIRYHNYYITNTGGYLSHEIKDNQYLVKTRNSYVILDNDYKPISTQEWMPQDLPLQKFPTRIEGLEDMRIFKYNDKIHYIATSCHYSPNYRMVMGEYNYIKKTFNNNKVLEPPTPTGCEKNWIPLIWKDRINFIYSWNPLQIGTLEDKKLEIFHSEKTPNYFSKMRGSSNPFKYNGDYWILTHSVKYTNPRKYYHQLVILDGESLRVKRYSLPFVFTKMTIEYCLSLQIKDNILTFIFSVFDCNSCIIQVPISKINFH